MNSIFLSATQFLNPGENFHFTRTVLTRKPHRNVHSHDFFEIFWLQHGRAKHIINGETNVLGEGDVLFIRPQDQHALQGKGEETHLVNVIFPSDLIDGMKQRYDLPNRFFWSQDAQPETLHRDIRQLAELSGRAMRLENGPRSLLAAEAFLLPLINDLILSAPSQFGDLPEWLTELCIAAQDPKLFREGAAGLANHSGRTHAHVSRTFQKYLGKTPSHYINEIRMAHAGRALKGTSDGISEIAIDCGIPNLSHFHKLFREFHDMTPNQYRKRFQKNAVQPI